MRDEIFPCPSCGFLVFGEPPGSYEICDLCGWEDDHVQLAHPAMAGGANKQSLIESQASALQKYPVEIATVGTRVRASGWRPLRQDEWHSAHAPTGGRSYFDAASEDGAQYYWLRDAAI